jgi:lysyl-tRNA synthetase class 2
VPLADVSISIRLDDGAFLAREGQRAGLVLMASLLLSFAFIRMSTRMIRAEVSWWPGNVTPGGLHIHHLVFGIVLLLLSGFLAVALQPASPWIEVLAALFGIGAGLTLDEFALWLYLEDVYWSEEGRRSVDAVILAAIIGGALVLGFGPVSSEAAGSLGPLLASLALVVGVCLTAAVKGKLWSAVGGMFIPLVGIVAAIRLARPGSPWARRRYAPGSAKLARAETRETRHRRRWQWLQDLIGGAPSEPSPRAAGPKDAGD